MVFTWKDKTQSITSIIGVLSPVKDAAAKISVAFDPKSLHGAVIMDHGHLRASIFKA